MLPLNIFICPHANKNMLAANWEWRWMLKNMKNVLLRPVAHFSRWNNTGEDWHFFFGSLGPKTENENEKKNYTCCHCIWEYEEKYIIQLRYREKIEIKTVLCVDIAHAIHAVETWALTNENTRDLHVFENSCLRSILIFKLLGRISINRIQKMTDINHDI